jgi:hypothetical protein
MENLEPPYNISGNISGADILEINHSPGFKNEVII